MRKIYTTDHWGIGVAQNLTTMPNTGNNADLTGWEDFEERFGEWLDAVTMDRTNPSGKLPYQVASLGV